jgi:nitrous oxidase accessory protein NosD
MVCLGVVCSTELASARVLRVPGKLPTIQAAVDAARDGDEIRVSPGAYCGATIDKRVDLVGVGYPRIIGCANGPLLGALRVGFYMPGPDAKNPANGSKISGFVFDGRGVSSANLAPLSFGIFARFARDIEISHNHFEGTAQAITNTGGDRWRIEHNRIHGLTLLDCSGPCTGGDGIVIQLARDEVAAPGGDAAPINRPEDNLVLDNTIEGSPPDGFADFSMVGILVFAADHTTVLQNDLRLRDNPAAAAVSQGILLTNTCCGTGVSYLPGTRHTIVAFNDGRKSEVAIVVEGSGGANTQGLFLFHNRGEQQLETTQKLLTLARNAAPPARARPQL